MADSFVKDPDAVLDYVFDWSSWLASGDTIASSAVTATAVTVTATDTTTTVVTVWVSGGTAGTPGQVTCQVTTADGRTDDRTIHLNIRER